MSTSLGKSEHKCLYPYKIGIFGGKHTEEKIILGENDDNTLGCV